MEAKAPVRDRKPTKKGSARGPRKGGHGGGGAWGTVEDERPMKLHKDDPMYDEEADEAAAAEVEAGELAELAAGSKAAESEPEDDGLPKLTLAEFKESVADTVSEYFSSEEADEAVRCIKDAGCSAFHFHIIKRAIAQAMGRKEREKELTSRLLVALADASILSHQDFEKGFERLLEAVDDLEIDNPDARRVTSIFLARAIADDLLPPSYVAQPLIVGLGGDVVEQAKVLLSRTHALVRMERIWGPGAGLPVEDLKAAVVQLLEEFLDSSDVDEAATCVRELDAPLFGHEIVKRAVVLGVDKKPEQQTQLSELLAALADKELLSTAQIDKGFKRVLADVDDLELDSPGAKEVVDGFVTHAVGIGILSATAV